MNGVKHFLNPLAARLILCPNEAMRLTKRYFREQGAKGGKLGGKIRAAKLTPQQRSAIARQGGIAKAAKRNGG